MTDLQIKIKMLEESDNMIFKKINSIIEVAEKLRSEKITTHIFTENTKRALIKELSRL